MDKMNSLTMRVFLRLLFIPGAVGWLLGGCSERIEPQPITYSQLLTGTEKKTWRIVSFQVFDQGEGSGVTPISESGVDACVTDDLFTFYADTERKLEISEGATKCDPADPDVFVTDNWTLVNASATLEFFLPLLGGKYPWIIKNLTERVLTIEYYIPNLDASYRFTFNATTTK